MEIFYIGCVIIFLFGLVIYVIESHKWLRRVHEEKSVNEKDAKAVAVRIAIISLISGLFASIPLIMGTLSSRLSSSPDIPIYVQNIYIAIFCTFGLMLGFLLTFAHQVFLLKIFFRDRPNE